MTEEGIASGNPIECKLHHIPFNAYKYIVLAQTFEIKVGLLGHAT